MAGIVKTTPAATESLADPVVCTMLFSRIEVRPRARKIVIESTAIGMEELTVSPILGEVDARRAEDKPEQHADDQGAWCQLGGRLRGRNVRLMVSHAVPSVKGGHNIGSDG